MSSGAISYYAEDFIGSSRVITTSAGATCYDADFYPYGAESNVTNTCPQNYKWTGKERDAETGNDNFDARYYSSVYGRFLSADWSAVPVAVPYANLTNPQTLNLYAIVRDNPESFADLDGHVLQEKQEDKDLENEIREEAEREREIEQAESRIASESAQKEEAARRDWESKQPNGFDDLRTGVCYAPQEPSMRSSRPGTLGKADHQQTVREEAEKMGGTPEVRVKTPGGEKSSRVIDAAKVENGRVTEATQVIRPNKNGTPPAREVRAARDIAVVLPSKTGHLS